MYSCSTELFEIKLIIYIKMDLTLNKLQRLICHKIQTKPNQAKSLLYTDADNTDDITLRANAPNQSESLLHSLKQSGGGIGLHMNSDKIEHMCFNWEWDTSTLNRGFLKLVEKFMYLGRGISSTDNETKMRPAKAWTAIDKLLTIMKSDRSDKLKQFFSTSGCVNSTIWMQEIRTDKAYREKARRELHKMLRAI